MNEPGFLPPPPPERSKAPILGIIACVAAVLSICLGCGIFGVSYALGSQYVTPGGTFDPNSIDLQSLSGYSLAILALICGSGLSALVGLGTGIASVVVDKSKVFGIIGLAISGLILLGGCGFIALSVFMTV